MVEIGKTDTTMAQIHDSSLPWLDTGTSIMPTKLICIPCLMDCSKVVTKDCRRVIFIYILYIYIFIVFCLTFSLRDMIHTIIDN